MQIRPKVLVQRIASRGREFEQEVSPEWLTHFQESHEREVLQLPDMKVWTLNSEIYDFRNPHDIAQIDRTINNYLAK